MHVKRTSRIENKCKEQKLKKEWLNKKKGKSIQ